jgi:large subunit ribosomal protein L22
MAFGVKTNERPGTRAQVRYVRMSAYKAREVLDLIRGQGTAEAEAVLQFVERDAAIVIRKCLQSAVANAVHNDEQVDDELFVSACYADEGPTLKRWRPRARGRATRIRKRTCHITIIVSRLTEEQLAVRRAKEAATPSSARARRAGRAAVDARRERVARSRQPAAEHDHEHEHDHDHDEVVAEEGVVDEASVDEAPVDEVEVDEVEVDEAPAEEAADTGEDADTDEDAVDTDAGESDEPEASDDAAEEPEEDEK